MNHTGFKVIWDIGQEIPYPRKNLPIESCKVMTLYEFYMVKNNRYVIPRLLKKYIKGAQYETISINYGNRP